MRITSTDVAYKGFMSVLSMSVADVLLVIIHLWQKLIRFIETSLTQTFFRLNSSAWRLNYVKRKGQIHEPRRCSRFFAWNNKIETKREKDFLMK